MVFSKGEDVEYFVLLGLGFLLWRGGRGLGVGVGGLGRGGEGLRKCWCWEDGWMRWLGG